MWCRHDIWLPLHSSQCVSFRSQNRGTLVLTFDCRQLCSDLLRFRMLFHNISYSRERTTSIGEKYLSHIPIIFDQRFTLGPRGPQSDIFTESIPASPLSRNSYFWIMWSTGDLEPLSITVYLVEQRTTGLAFCRRAKWVTHLNQCKFCAFSKDWTPKPDTLGLTSKLLTKFSHHILPILRGYRCSNTDSLQTFCLQRPCFWAVW